MTAEIDQFRSVESEEEEDERNAVTKKYNDLSLKASSDFPSGKSKEENVFHFMTYDEVNSSDGEAAVDDDDFDDMSTSKDDYSDVAMALFGEDKHIPDREMQRRYQGYLDRINLNVKEKGRLRDRSDHATTEHALDHRTQTILFTMMQQKVFHTINGCISTGKEANVYHALGQSGEEKEVHYGVKVYMTSTTSFRDREKYVSGDFRMRNTAHRHNSYAMVKVWAEKEFRNLSRIFNGGKIPAPKPYKVKGVVLVMDFIGDQEGFPAPKLKDAAVEEGEWRTLYWQIVSNMRVLHQECGLVHGDLNEYNLLYKDGKAWFIDVSQSVMHEKNPNALRFLRKDCFNVTNFFRSRFVDCLTVRELFDFIVRPVGVGIGDIPSPDPVRERKAAEEAHLEAAKAAAEGRPEGWRFEEDGAFLDEHIPMNLAEVERPARDIRAVRVGRIGADQLAYAGLSGLTTEDFLSLKAKKRLEMKREKERKKDKANVEGENPAVAKIEKEEEEEEEQLEEERKEDEKMEECESDEEADDRFRHPQRPQHESSEARKNRKAAVKAAQREQRALKKEKRLQEEKKERAKQRQQKPKFTRL